MGVEDHMNSRSLFDIDTHKDEIVGEETNGAAAAAVNSNRLRRKFSSRSIDFFSNSSDPNLSTGKSMYCGKTAHLTCMATSSLVAVITQMLSHRARHVWVMEIDNGDILVGLVGYTDILTAIPRQPAAAPATLDSNL